MDFRKWLFLVCFVVVNCGIQNNTDLKDVSVVKNYLATPGLSMKFKRIRKGSFLMGSPDSEADGHSHETQHRVSFSKDFNIGVTEVTQLQWFMIMGNNPSRFKEKQHCPNGHSIIYNIPLCPNFPVETVSLDDIHVFINKLNERNEGRYRLPTEAEWEYAARAGTSTPFNLGADIFSDQVNFRPFDDDPKRINRNQTVAVAHLDNANRWGLYDMHGNVWEWVSDWYGKYPDSDVTDYKGPSSGSNHIIRGGGWTVGKLHCRSAYRGIWSRDRGSFLGFRLAKD